MRTRIMPNSGTPSNKKSHFLVVIWLALAFFACSDVNFDRGEEGNHLVGPTDKTPCSDIGGPFPSSEHGMYGVIHAVSPQSCEPHPFEACDSPGEIFGANSTRITDIVISAPLVETRPFSVGFETRDGDLVKYPSNFGNMAGQPIVEFWGAKVKTNIALMEDDKVGDYQLAVLADDGFRLTRLDTGEVLLNIKGINSTILDVSAKMIKFEKGKRIPFQIEYYQTPRTEIAFLMLWRKNPSSLHDEEDGREHRGDYYFDWHNYNESTQRTPPTDEFKELIDRGWRPLRPENFWMPDSIKHECV